MVERLDVLRVVHVVDAEESLAGAIPCSVSETALTPHDDVVALDLRLDLGELAVDDRRRLL